ncbi:MAG: hypothetical protein K0R12_962, partial [Gammaproteobacteria bacterium]|nr:hypothetical protein [Gammaproteobacteria bacterium]
MKKIHIATLCLLFSYKAIFANTIEPIQFYTTVSPGRQVYSEYT